METFQGNKLIIPKTTNWKLVDETDKYSKTQRDICTKQSNHKCTLYQFPVGMKILEIFKPKRWLDPTAGWGDRLRIAIASGVEYVGVDSNLSMQSAYKAIIDDKAKGDNKKYKVIPSRFQDAKITGKFDLVFTSPPFFTVEIYENMIEWKDVEEFMEEFLKPLLSKSYKHLEKGGHLVLYIEDRPDAAFIDLMKEYVTEELPDLEYQGVIYYQGKQLRPHYVWKKV